MKKILSIMLSVAMVFSLSATAFAAERQMTVDEAKEYLQTYNVTKINEAGKEYITQYIFSSEEDLNKAAVYIADKGLAAFNSALDSAVAEVVRNEPQSTLLRPYTTDLSTVHKTVSGNGDHYVSAETSGLASFDTLGTVEYVVALGYMVTVRNGAITNLTSISFDIPYISSAGSWGNARFPSYHNNTNCGVTANYDITKTVEIGIGDFSFEIKSETDNDVFSILTRLQ